MNIKKLGIGAASLAAVGALVLGGATFASAADNPTPTTQSSAGATSSPDATGKAGQSGGSQDTPVTGEEATKVSAAVTAKDSAVTVESVRKDPDGSYDVLGTKAGARVMFDVSADLATVTENAGGPGMGGKGGPGGMGGQHTEVTGEEATKVSAAVTGKDSAVTVEKVMKDADGSYDVLGTKAGARVMFDVSADLATVTENAGGPGMGGKGGSGGMGGQHTEVTGDEASKVSAAVTGKDSAVTVEKVMKDADGSYDVLGTKAGARVMFDVSADLATVTENAGGPGMGGGKGGHGQRGQQQSAASATTGAAA
jgi:hypothetical protein